MSVRTSEDIQRWLVERVAGFLELTPTDIDVRAPFQHYGLDSMEQLRVIGELETWLQRELDETLLRQYPTIESVAAFLSKAA
ncbi:acyl carrier protein [Archangium violaceum]|uniref:acyl carrier protein n=1 Tax=Archangium violaceum TaxID=83451 RepID=UPI002B2F273D|nr:acyl carrier protein [Archangium gephyra]WPB78145.1 acyl carrier protein [Archangium gephyra]